MRFYLVTRILISIYLISSCNSKVDCNLDLEYKDELTYYKGKLFSGDCESFFDNGNIMNHQKYLNGMDHGNWTFYFKNGKVETEANFIENKRHGRWTYYFDDGKTIRQISHYNNGKKDSIWIRFSGDKKIEWKKTFKNDNLIKK